MAFLNLPDPSIDRSSMDDMAPPLLEPTVRDWSLMPLDALASIFVSLGAVEVLMGAGLVCRSWLEAAKLPDVWRAVDMQNHEVVFEKDDFVLCAMAKAAVDRSDGQLRVFAGMSFVTDELLQYIFERSPSLTTLRLTWCDVFRTRPINVIRESPVLELRTLELDGAYMNAGELADVLARCPLLEVLGLHDCFQINDDGERALREKFARIKNLMIEWRAEPIHIYSSDYGNDDCVSVPDFEDECNDYGNYDCECC
ncbi:putative F-box/LRR-repeat protein 23 [Triticum aestivum]|uniref:putative F-box/LRR-repeat protein 23 n=2 Tax=Triticinae TaxID=1648030 RepID=UPI001D009096|nr:putative F-box/LRR-repeat protein 23 [Triticum aestivum]